MQTIPIAQEQVETAGRPARATVHVGLAVVVAALAGLLLSMVASTLVWQWEKKQSDREFSAAAQSHFLALQRGLDEYLNKLNAMRALFESSENVTRSEFEAFTGRLLENEKAIQNFSWVPRVKAEQRESHESQGLREQIPNYQIKAVRPDQQIVPSPSRDEYLPIFYSSVPRSSRVYGIDLLSQPIIGERLERARDDDALSALPDFILHSTEGDAHGFLFSLPIYARGQPRFSVAQRRESFIGFVHGAFVTVEAMEHILSKTTTARGMDLSLFLFDSLPDAQPLYFHSSRLRSSPSKAKSLGELVTDRHETGVLSSGSARWSLLASPVADGPLDVDHARAWLVLLAGLLVTAILAQYMHSSSRHAQELQEANDQISRLARRDSLTGLYNRRAFNEFLETAFTSSRRNNGPFSILYFDLDRFKAVNDTYGHPVGDLLLKQVAARASEVIRKSEVFARLGGDEFAVLQADTDRNIAGRLAKRLIKRLSEPFQIEGRYVRVSASIGIAQYSVEFASPDALMARADLALYQAKTDGRNCFRFDVSEIDNPAIES